MAYPKAAYFKKLIGSLNCYRIIPLFLLLFSTGDADASNAIIFNEPRTDKVIPSPKQNKIYVYSPHGKTDPFVSFLRPASTDSNIQIPDNSDSENPWSWVAEDFNNELRKIEISKLALTAIFKTKDKIRAMVIDPKGKGHFLMKGSYVGIHGGIVDDIVYEERKALQVSSHLRKVIFKEPYRNRDGTFLYRFVEMEIPGTFTIPKF